MLIADDLTRNSDDPLDVSVGRLIHEVGSGPGDGYPVHCPLLNVYVEYSAARGPGRFRVVVWQAAGRQVFGSRIHPVVHGDDPVEVRSIIVRLTDCWFDSPGLYWVDFRYEGETLISQPIMVR